MPTLLSGGKPVTLDAYLPPSAGPHPAILLLHGSGGNISFWLDRFAAAATRLGVAIYAVHYFERTGTTRADPITLQDGIHVPLWLETIHDTLIHIAAQPGIDPERIALLGISLGAFLSLALAAGPDPQQLAGHYTPRTPPIRSIVEISGGVLPPYDARVTSSFPPTLIIHGTSDAIVPVSLASALNDLLSELHVRHETLIIPGEGHWFSQPAQMRILAATAAFLGSTL